MPVVNPSMVNALTGRTIDVSPDIGGAIGQGLQNAGRIQAHQVVRQKLAERSAEQKRAADMQRMLGMAGTREERMNALMAYDPATAIDYQDSNLAVDKFNTEAEQNALASTRRGTFFRHAGLDPAQESFAAAFPDDFASAYAKNAFASDEPPETRTRIEGDKTIEEEWTGEGWREIGRGPRWRPDAPGTTIYDPATGNPIATIGGAPVSTKLKNEIGGQALDAANALARLDTIAQGYDRRFLEFGTRAWAIGQDLLDKFNAGTASPEEEAFLDDMYAFYSDAFNNVNITLKELSGGAVTAQEEIRQRNDLPAPGELTMTKLLSGDGPRRFAAKLKTLIRRQKLALARHQYYLNTGQIESFEQMREKGTLPSLLGSEGATGVDKLIEQRGQELETMYKRTNPGVTQDEVATWVSDRLSQEFGIRIGAQ